MTVDIGYKPPTEGVIFSCADCEWRRWLPDGSTGDADAFTLDEVQEHRAAGYVIRGDDRRGAPRRAEEVNLHYAEVGLIAAALALVERSSAEVRPYSALIRAAGAYRDAELSAVAARREMKD